MRIRTSLTALGLTAALALAGCAETTSQSSGQVAASVPVANPVPAKVETVQIFNDVYGPVTDAGYALPAIPIILSQRMFPEAPGVQEIATQAWLAAYLVVVGISLAVLLLRYRRSDG